MYYPEKLTIARKRRGLTKVKLAEQAGISTRTLSTYENPDLIDSIQEDTLAKLADALKYPVNFFYEGLSSTVTSDAVSFRAMSKLSSMLRDSALSAGDLAVILNNWMEEIFDIPLTDLPDYSKDQRIDPEQAAISLRQELGIGELSISNIIHLIESRGVRVFSLSENCIEVDAFSFWQDGKAFMLLNTFKTPERSRFDAAHELGHLILHKQIPSDRKQAEVEADQFASAFLMPMNSVLSRIPITPTFQHLDALKKNWKVSLAALVKRIHDLKLTTEWQNRSLNIELSKRGYRKAEPNSSFEKNERETSLLLKQTLDYIHKNNMTGIEISNKLGIPLDELSNLTFRHPLFMTVIKGENKAVHSRKNNILRVVD
ncbi:XRE family transcriptional regulator [Wohlfahrtiimonas chitiniclastica]|uniref:helix-turn-helix domain-containing protein n=1 Tax=Wohlfahrtiimonas chitiniclastica TaxID=400946 RepID=UPI0007B411A3|nr:XRE family transcriptional regulator [Wohlfahrtiimonas chitiniclastica]KZS22217.1 XRE family transcriptional regulator [Wohlfahrtiimonas chitiniclastica]MBS7814772.1 ImmA/IrrE family metallo-endopeptidase [Wohlfahrtiimonas chitiniclastica]WHR54747.1 XRE family transcriptional regulator [Wohlfahrtiimonas chitiniclastica]